MNRLPTGWVQKRLGDVATLQRGFDLPVQDRKEGPVKIFAANGPVGTHDIHKVLGPGVVTGRSGTLGKVHFVEGDFWPLNTALWVKDFHGNDPAWVCRLLTWMRLEQFTRGAGVPTLNRNLVHEVEIPLPPLEEQRRIAAILDQADALRRLRHRTLTHLNTLAQSIFHEMFGAPENPLKWRHATKTLDDLCTKITDGTHQAPNWADQGVPFIFVSSVRNQKISLDTQKFVSREEYLRLTKSAKIEDDDVLYTCVGSYGNAAVVSSMPEFIFQRHIAHIKPDPEQIDSYFLSYCLESPALRHEADKVATGIAQKTVTLKGLKSFLIPCPSMELQKKFSLRIAKLSTTSETYEVEAGRLKQLFTSLQHRAFRGEL